MESQMTDKNKDKMCLLYLAEKKITDISQVTAADRKVLYSILDK